jgi:streptogramin lyase
MNMRRYLVSLAAVVVLAGCSQGTGLAPQGANGVVPFGVVHAQSGTAHAAGLTVKFFDTPTQFSWPDYVTKGPDGNLYFSEFYADQIGRITPKGVITEFPLLPDNDIEGITTGPDGNIWFTEPGADNIGRMTLKGVVTSFPVKGYASPRGITAGPDGNLWFTDYESSKIGRITPKGVIRQFTIPGSDTSPWGITTGKDGDLWFAESFPNLIGRFDPKTLKFVVPGLRVPGYYPTPWGIMQAANGQMWFTERRLGRIGTIVGGRVKEFQINPSSAYPDTIAQTADGTLWITENQTNAIAHFDPTTGKFMTAVQLPTGDIPTGIAVGADGNVWFAVASYTTPGQIGEIVLH